MSLSAESASSGLVLDAWLGSAVSPPWPPVVAQPVLAKRMGSESRAIRSFIGFLVWKRGTSRVRSGARWERALSAGLEAGLEREEREARPRDLHAAQVGEVQARAVGPLHIHELGPKL